jgi:putative transposase
MRLGLRLLKVLIHLSRLTSSLTQFSIKSLSLSCQSGISLTLSLTPNLNFIDNMALSLRQQLYGVVKTSDSKAIGEIKKILTNHIKKRPENAWMNELSSRVYQNALRDLNDAFSRFRKGLAGHPSFTNRKDGQSFTVDNSIGKTVLATGNKIKIPTLGTFRLHEPLGERYVTQTFNLTKEGKNWFVSFCIDADRLPVNQSQEAVGIDLGIKSFATLSTSETFDAPKPLKQAKTKLAMLQRKASRQIKGSNNQRKTYDKIRELYFKISCIRKDFLHKLTTYVAKTFKLIKIEDLNVSGMLANHKLAGAIEDLGFYEFRRQLEYKSLMYGSKVEAASQWFPSSKTCSNCGHVQDMPLHIRVYDCSNCGMSKDRDLNAAINILNYQPSA